MKYKKKILSQIFPNLGHCVLAIENSASNKVTYEQAETLINNKKAISDFNAKDYQLIAYIASEERLFRCLRTNVMHLNQS